MKIIKDIIHLLFLGLIEKIDIYILSLKESIKDFIELYTNINNKDLIFLFSD